MNSTILGRIISTFYNLPENKEEKNKVRVNESSPVSHYYVMLNVEEINCLLFMKHFFKFLPKKVLLLILVQLNSYLSPAHQMISIVKSILFQMSLFLGVWISPSCLSYPIYAIKEC